MTKTEVQYYSNIINGEQMTPETNKWMDSIDPATGKAWAKIPLSTESDADKACKAANGAFPEWSKLSARMRGNYLRQVGDALTEHIDELLELETKNNGWVLDESRYGGIVLQDLWYDAAGAAPVIGSRGQTTQMGWNHFGYTTRVPFGVVLGIIPWNAGLFTFTIKAAYALAAGNTIVIKPSEQASVASLRYGEILSKVLPPGVVNVISGLGGDIGDALVSHKHVNKVSLTGSRQTAKAISKNASNDPKPLVLELGGKSPNIVFEDADLETAAVGVLNGIYSPNAGQICSAGSRILIQRSIFDEMIALLKKKMTAPDAIRYGDTLDTNNNMGPIANKPQYDKVIRYLKMGEEEGAEIVFGGRYGGENILPNQPEYQDGYWVEPTLFKAENNDLRIVQEEIFGPIAVVTPFEDEEEAVQIANNTEYGLAAGVWTNNLQLAHRMVEKVEAGNVWVNTYFGVGPDLPFGGFKGSGYGTDSILEYTREKASIINYGS